MKPKGTLWLAPLALVLLAGQATAKDALGQVTSLQGDVHASGPGGTSRALACGDPIYAGDTVTTGSGASVGILMDDLLARIQGSSELRLGRTGEGAPDAELTQGRVRVIDAREKGAPAQLAARDSVARISGNDAEAYVLTEKLGPYAMFCEWQAPLAVRRGKQSELANPDQCVIAKNTEPLYLANAQKERIPATGGETCPPDLAALGAPGPHFSPVAAPDVAAGPPGRWSSLAQGVPAPSRGPCDDPGSGCASAGGIVVSEPPPGGLPTP